MSGYPVWLVKTGSQGSPQWNQTLGNAKYPSLIQTADGGFAMVGSIDGAQFMLAKVNRQGNLQWNITYGGAGIGLPYSVVQTSDGGYAVGGWMNMLNNEGGPNDVVIVKTDAEGNVAWTQNYGMGLVPYTMTETSDGGFVLAGDRLLKVDAAGSEQWEISFGGQTFPGGQASCVVQTQDGGYAVAGQTLPPPDYSSAKPWLTEIDVVSTNQTTQPTASPSPTMFVSASPGPTVPEFSTVAVILAMVIAAWVIVFTFVRLKSTRRAFL